MLKGIYSAASGMTSQMMLTDVVADNLANMNTPGYKASGVEFKPFGQTLIDYMGNNQTKPLGTMASGSEVMATVVNFAQGDLTQTGSPLDLALHGQGFFTVKVPQTGQILYTRAGNFTRDEKGYLITMDGERVQGDHGDILIPKGAKKIDISEIGEVKVDGNTVGKLKIAQFQNMLSLKRMGSSLFETTETPLPKISGVQVEQGFLERSNVNMISQMVNSISGLRTYETMQKTIQLQNETLQKSVNNVGTV